jgi:DNA gyrase/topoisomerase IV subunit B
MQARMHATPNRAPAGAIDNSSGGGFGGFARNIAAVSYENGSAEVADDGRGIQINIHAKKEVPAVQGILTTLHFGGKFRMTGENAAYRIAGGLHGAGIRVTNASATRLEVEDRRDCGRHRSQFADYGKVKSR